MNQPTRQSNTPNPTHDDPSLGDGRVAHPFKGGGASRPGSPPSQGPPRESAVKVAVCPTTPDPLLRSKATQLADRLALPLTHAADAAYDLLLTVTPSRLELRDNTPTAPGPVYVDFVTGPVGYHRRAGRLEQQRLLFKAIGRSSDNSPRNAAHDPTPVVDATAGLARDAFLLACKGYRVTAIERSPVLAALIQDGIDRSTRFPRLHDVFNNCFRLIQADARETLSSICATSPPPVIYLDPMFPPKKKSALVKKQMRFLRRLVGDDHDAADLFAAAQACDPKRIVVKRLRHAPPLAFAPTRSLKGKSTRYDIYEK